MLLSTWTRLRRSRRVERWRSTKTCRRSSHSTTTNETKSGSNINSEGRKKSTRLSRNQCRCLSNTQIQAEETLPGISSCHRLVIVSLRPTFSTKACTWLLRRLRKLIPSCRITLTVSTTDPFMQGRIWCTCCRPKNSTVRTDLYN